MFVAMLQKQARMEDEAVQLHEKLEAKRAASHAEKVCLAVLPIAFQSIPSLPLLLFSVVGACKESSAVFDVHVGA